MTEPNDLSRGAIVGSDWARPRQPPADLPPGESRFQNLAGYQPSGYHPGRGPLVRVLWYFVSLCFFESGWLPLSRVRIALLKAFGAQVGQGVVIKPHVRIKHPWRLSLGSHTWIGEQAWIDNLAPVDIGSHTCISQGVYLCTGSHDHKKTTFDLLTAPITIGDACWLGCFSVVLGGCRIPNNTVVVAKTLVTPRSLDALSTHAGESAEADSPEAP